MCSLSFVLSHGSKESVVSTQYGRKVAGGSCCAMSTMQAGEEASERQETRSARVTPSTASTEGKRSLDVQEFQRCYQDNLDLIYRYVFRQVGNQQEAEDLTSHIFLKAVRFLVTMYEAYSMRKWLFQVARTTVAHYWRAHYRTPVQSLEVLEEAGWEGPAEEDIALASSEPVERVERLLQALPERYREVLTCRFLLTLSIKETAVRMGLTEANVKILQYRALKRAAELEDVLARSNLI
jgi:RNA polymerase sigma-70 factor (ECF subfamily)